MRVIGVGHPYRLLAEKREVPFRQYDPVSDDVVQMRHSGRARKAEVVDLNRSGPHRKDTRTAADGVSPEIDGNVDPLIVN